MVPELFLFPGLRPLNLPLDLHECKEGEKMGQGKQGRVPEKNFGKGTMPSKSFFNNDSTQIMHERLPAGCLTGSSGGNIPLPFTHRVLSECFKYCNKDHNLGSKEGKT